MGLSERMQELQNAMARYSQLTVENYKVIYAFGEAIVTCLPGFLGEGAAVIGVPPFGEYKTDVSDYRGAKFSTHSTGTLTLAPIQMGVVVGIPHSKGNGKFWLRVVVEFEMIGGTLSVSIGDDPATVRGMPIPHTADDVEQVCGAIYEYLRLVLENPVRAATAVGKGRLGFI